MPAEAGDAMPAETGGAALAGIKRETTWEGGQERRSQQQQCLLKLGMLRRPGSREGVGGQECIIQQQLKMEMENGNEGTA